MDVNAKIKELVAVSFSIDQSQLEPKVNFFKDLGADSLLMLSFISALEREFDIEVTDKDFDQLYCIQNILDFLKTKAAIN